MQEPANPQGQESLAERARRRARAARPARPGAGQGQQVAPSAPGTPAPGQAAGYAAGWQNPYASGAATPVLTGQEGIGGPTHGWADVAGSVVDALTFGVVPHDTAWQWMASVGSAPTDPINTPEYWAAVHERLARGVGTHTKTQQILSQAAWIAAAAVPFLGEASAMRALGATGRGGRMIREGKALMKSADVAERARGAQMYAEGLSASNTMRRIMMGQSAPGASGISKMGVEAAHTAALLTIDTGLRSLTNRLTPLNALSPQEEGYLRANPHTSVKGRKYDPTTGSVRWIDSEGNFSDSALGAAVDAALLDGFASTALLSIGGATLSRVFGIGRNFALKGAEDELRAKFFKDAERVLAKRKAGGEVFGKNAIEEAWSQYQGNPQYAALVLDMASKSAAHRLGTDIAQPLILGAALHQLHDPDAGWGESIMVGGLSFVLGHIGSKKLTSKLFKAHRAEAEELRMYADTFREIERHFNEAAMGINGAPAQPAQAAKAQEKAAAAEGASKEAAATQGGEAVVSEQTGRGKTAEADLPLETAAAGVKVQDANTFARKFAKKIAKAKKEQWPAMLEAVDPALRPIAQKVIEEAEILDNARKTAVTEIAEPGKESEVPVQEAASRAKEIREEIKEDKAIEAFESAQKANKDVEEAAQSAYLSAKKAAISKTRERRKRGFSEEESVSGRRATREDGKVVRNRYAPTSKNITPEVAEGRLFKEAAESKYDESGRLQVGKNVGRVLDVALAREASISAAEKKEKATGGVKEKLRAAREAKRPYREERNAKIRELRRPLTREEEKALREKHAGAIAQEREAKRAYGESRQAMLSGEELHTRAEKDFLNKLLSVVRDAAQKGTGIKKGVSIGKRTGIAIARAASSGFTTKTGKDGQERRSALVNIEIAPEHAELAGMGKATTIPMEMSSAEMAFSGLGAVVKDRPVALVYSISESGAITVHTPRGVATFADAWKGNQQATLREAVRHMKEEDIEALNLADDQAALLDGYVEKGTVETEWRTAPQSLAVIAMDKSVEITSGLSEAQQVAVAEGVKAVKSGEATIQRRLRITEVELSSDHNDIQVDFTREMRISWKKGGRTVTVPYESKTRRFIPLPARALARIMAQGSGMARERGEQAERYTVEAEQAAVERLNTLGRQHNTLVEDIKKFGFYDEVAELAKYRGAARSVLEEDLRLSLNPAQRDALTRFLELDSAIAAEQLRLETLRAAPDVSAELPETGTAFHPYSIELPDYAKADLAERGAIADLLREAGAFKAGVAFEGGKKSTREGVTGLEAEMRGEYASTKDKGGEGKTATERATRVGVARAATADYVRALLGAEKSAGGKDALPKLAEGELGDILVKAGAARIEDTPDGRVVTVKISAKSRALDKGYTADFNLGESKMEVRGSDVTFTIPAEGVTDLTGFVRSKMPAIIRSVTKSLYSKDAVEPRFGAPPALVADLGHTIRGFARSRSKEASWGYGTQYHELRGTVSITGEDGSVIAEVGTQKGTSKFLSILEQASAVLRGAPATSELRVADLLDQRAGKSTVMEQLYDSLKETGDIPADMSKAKFSQLIHRVVGDSRVGRNGRVSVRLRGLPVGTEQVSKIEADKRDRAEALAAGVRRLETRGAQAKLSAVDQARLVTLRKDLATTMDEIEAIRKSSASLEKEQAEIDVAAKAVLRLFGRQEGGEIQKAVKEAVKPKSESWVEWRAKVDSDKQSPAPKAAEGGKKKSELEGVSPETEALVPPMRGGLRLGGIGSSARKAMDLFNRNLNRLAQARLANLPESLTLGERVAHVFKVDVDAPLAVLQRIVNASGGITPTVGGGKGASFGVSPEAALSVLRTITGISESGEARGGRGARQSFRSNLRLSAEIVAQLGITRDTPAEDLAEIGVVMRRGEFYLKGGAWGLRGEDAQAAYKMATKWIAEQSKLSSLQQDALDVTRLLMDTEAEKQIPKEVLDLFLPTDEATLMERFGRTSLAEIQTRDLAISAELLGIGEGEVSRLHVRRLGKHTTSQRRFYPPAIVTLASVRRAARMGALHSPTEVVMPDGTKATMSMLEAAAYKIFVGGMSKLKTSEADGVRWSKVMVEYAAGLGSDLGKMREDAKSARERAREIIESGVRESELKDVGDVGEATGKEVKRSSLWKARNASIEEVLDLAAELGERYDAQQLSALVRMAARPGAGSAVALKAEAMKVLGEPNAAILDIKGETALEALAVILRSRIAADAAREVMFAQHTLHAAATSPAFLAGVAGKPLRLIELGEGRDSVVDRVVEAEVKAPEPLTGENIEVIREAYETGVEAMAGLIETAPAVYESAVRAIKESPEETRASSVRSYIDEAFFHAYVPSAAGRLAEAVGIPRDEAIAVVKAWQIKANIDREMSGKKLRDIAQEYLAEPLKELGIEINPTMLRAEVAKEVPGSSLNAAKLFQHVSHMATSSTATGDKVLDRLQATLRAGKPLSEMSEKAWAEMKQAGLGREVKGERVLDYANLHAKLLKSLDPARLAMGHDVKGPNCSCDTAAQTWARALAKGEEMGNEHVRHVIEGGYKRITDMLAESMKSWPPWAKKLGTAIGQGAKDIADVFGYWRVGLARWEMHRAVEDIDPQVRSLISRATSEGLSYKAALDRFKEGLSKTGDSAKVEKDLERYEYMLYKFWDDAGIMVAKSYEKTATPREIQAEKARRMGLRQQAIENRLRKEAPELIPALEAVKTMLEIDASIWELARSKPGQYLLRLGGARSAAWAGKRLSRVYVDMAKRSVVGMPETTGLSLSKSNLGFFKTRRPTRQAEHENVVPLFSSDGTIADRALLGRALPLVSNYTVNPKLAGIHMTAQLNYLVDRFGVNEADLTDDMKGSKRFGRPMYVKLGDPIGTARTTEIWYQTFDEARTPAYARRSRAAVQAIKQIFMDERYQHTRKKQLAVINKRRAAQGKPPLALKSADKKRYQPIGGRKGDVAKLIKRLQSTYLPRDLALEIEDQILLQSGYYRSNLLHKFGALWAASKTVGRPRHYVATWLSMMALNHMHGGMPLTFFPGYWKSALREVKFRQGQYYDEIRDRLPASELADSDMSASVLQIVDMMPMMTPWAIDSGKSLAQVAEMGWRIGNHDWTARRVYAAGKAAQEKAFHFYRQMELAGKLALYRYLREDGVPKDEAWLRATKATIDPTTTPAALRHISRGILGGFDSRGILQAKFMTWRLRVLPTVVEASWKRPVTMMKLAAMMGLVNSAAAAMSGWTDEESQDVMASLRRERGWLAGTLSGATTIPMGKTDEGRLRSLDLWHVIPFQDLALAGGMPSIQPLQTAVELAAGRTFGMYPRELRPPGSYLGEQVLSHADHLFGQMTPLYNELHTVLGPKSIREQWRPAPIPGLDEQGPTRVFWDTVKAGALPVRTWTPSLSLGLDDDYRKAQDDVGFARDRSELAGDSAKNGHIFRRLASIARDQGMEKVVELIQGLKPAEQRFVVSNIRELAFYASDDEMIKRYVAFAGFSANDFMTGAMKGEHWTSDDVPYLRVIANLKAENSESVDPELYYEFLDWIGRIAWR